MPDPRTRERLLDAAEAVVIEQGVARLTLDAVAAAARTSKGGLLYHFASKDALVVGLVGRLTARIEHDLAERVRLDPEPVGRHTRAYLALAFPATDDRLRATLAAALIGALGTT
ncbi:MAG: TetR/AcrR family transcriptional regulator, partial [Myxococcales bacterium]